MATLGQAQRAVTNAASRGWRHHTHEIQNMTAGSNLTRAQVQRVFG